MSSPASRTEFVTTFVLTQKRGEPNNQIDDLRKAFKISDFAKFDYLELPETVFIKQWPASSQCPVIHSLFFSIYPSMVNKERMITLIEGVPVLIAKVSGQTLLYFVQTKDVCEDPDKCLTWRSAFVQWRQDPSQQLKMIHAGYIDNNVELIQELFKGNRVELTFCDTLERRIESYKQSVRLQN